MHESRLNRREFLASSAALAAAGATFRASAAEAEKRNEQPGMAYTVLGRTGCRVSRLAFGCAQLTADKMPVFERAIERGVNLIQLHATYVKGQAVTHLSEWLKRPGNRDKVFIMLSAGPKLESDLQNLGTDHVDMLVLPKHSVGEVKDAGVAAQLEAFKKTGKARYAGLATHKTSELCTQAAIDSGLYDYVMPTVGLSNLEAFLPVLLKAKERNVGILAMKSLQNSKGKGTNTEVAKGLLAAGVTSIVKTLTSFDDLDQFTAGVTAGNRQASLQRALELGREIRLAGGLCNLCGVCRDCPKGVDIQGVLRNYQYYYQQVGCVETARERYAELEPVETALSCVNCARCEKVCPLRVPVRQLIRDAHDVLA